MRPRRWEEGEKKNPKTKPPKFLSSQNEGLHRRMKGLSNRTRSFLLRKTWRIHALMSAEERVRTGLATGCGAGLFHGLSSLQFSWEYYLSLFSPVGKQRLR